ncbi:MAG: peptide ABC transporter substrate-binding protein, partial [Alphaproteobacteria bacterium]
VYTYKLRDGLKWSDGVPVTARDFVFSFERILDPKTAGQYASVLYPIKNAQAVNEGKLPPSAVGVKALDDKTVQITLEHPTPYLPTLLTHQTAQPTPKHIIEKYGDKWTTGGIMVTDGPYKLAEWVPNSDVKLVKNPYYYDADKVQIDVVYYYPILDQSTELDRYKAGQLDFTDSMPVREIPRLQSEFPGQVHMHAYMANSYLQINVNKKPFNDVRVREALSLAIDRELICDKILNAGETPSYTFVPPGMANYEAGAALSFKYLTMDQRRAKARDLLAQAGFTLGNPLKFTYRYMESGDNRRVAIAVAGMWKQIGVQADLLNTDPRVHYNALRTQDFEVADAGWVADYNDAQNFLFLMESTSGQMNYSKYANPKYDALMHQAAATLDLKARAELLRDAEQIILDDAPVIPEYFAATRQLVRPYVEGFKDNLLKWHRTRYMRIERTAALRLTIRSN